MVRLSLDMCLPDLVSPCDIFMDKKKSRLLVKRGAQLSSRVKELLVQNKVEYLDFPLPYETQAPPPYTFSEETENALFRLIRNTYIGYKKDSIENPTDIRKAAYEILAQAYNEFRVITRRENPSDDTPPRRTPQSVLHLRTIGSLEDHLFEHAKNVGFLCLVTAWDYFKDSKQHLADIHKLATAGIFADIGMMKVPSRIIKKQEKLSDKDLEIIHQHVEASAQFVDTLYTQNNFITVNVVRQHHERCDGSGYPAKLRAHKFEPYTYLLNVVDSYSSMICTRFFRSSYNPVNALWELNAEAGKKYEENAVKCLNHRVAPFPVGTVAKFTEKRLVQIVELDNIPTEFDKVQILKKGLKENPYNIPKSIRAFAPDRLVHKLKVVTIKGHLDKIGNIIDVYDLLQHYGYSKNDKSVKVD